MRGGEACWFDLFARNLRVSTLPPTQKGLAGDKVWAALPAQDKINMQEKGICPPNRESECFFDWLHWKSQLVLDKHELTAALAPLIAGVVDRAAGAAL